MNAIMFEQIGRIEQGHWLRDIEHKTGKIPCKVAMQHITLSHQCPTHNNADNAVMLEGIGCGR